jgi:predicted DNA-binding transcriptional regulator AlpA
MPLPFTSSAEFSEQDLDRVRHAIEQLSATAAPSAPRAIRRPRVLDLTGFGKSHIYNLADEKCPSYDPTWPLSFRLGTSANSPVVWWEREVVEWVQSKAAAAEALRNEGSKRAVQRVGAARRRIPEISQ